MNNHNIPEEGYFCMFPTNLLDQTIMTNACIYGIIHSLTRKNGYCYATNGYLAKALRVSPMTIRRGIHKLEELGYIQTEQVGNERQIRVHMPNTFSNEQGSKTKETETTRKVKKKRVHQKGGVHTRTGGGTQTNTHQQQDTDGTMEPKATKNEGDIIVNIITTPKGVAEEPAKPEVQEQVQEPVQETKLTYGRQDINEVISYLKEGIRKCGDGDGSTPQLDGSEQQNRRYAKLWLDKLRKTYPEREPLEVAKKIIDIAHCDGESIPSATGVKYFYYNTQKLIGIAKYRKQLKEREETKSKIALTNSVLADIKRQHGVA